MPRIGLAFVFVLISLSAQALEPPVLLDPEVAARLLTDADGSEFSDADRLIIFDRDLVQVEDTGLGHRYKHRFVKVIDDSGTLPLRAIRFDYDPSSNFIQVIGVRVHRTGGEMEDVDLTALRDAVQPTGGINWGARMKVLALPPLQTGDGVEYLTYTKGFLIAYLADEPGDGTDNAVTGGSESDNSALDDPAPSPTGAEADDDERYIPPMRGHFYDVVTFQENLPALERSYTVTLPRNKPLQYSVYNGEVMSSLILEPELFIYRFWKNDVPGVKREPRMPDLTDVAPKVVMATTETWAEKSRWFFETNEWVFASTPEIDAKVLEITSGLRDDDAKIAALLHWVAQNIRYFGLTMGKGEGYTIHPSEMTYRDRCGVCKDIAGMLVTMLRSAGYETYAAMTSAGNRVEAIPADQFNHCVVALKRDSGEYLMLDPTWAPWNNPLWSRWEGEQNYVIGTDTGDSLSIIPPFTPEDNLLIVESEARLLDDGTLQGTIRLEGRGISDGRLRGIAANRDRRTIGNYLERWLSVFGDRVELKEYLFSDHHDFTRDTTLRLVYEVPGFADLLEDDLEFHSPALMLLARNGALSRLAGVPQGKSREHGLFMWAPQLVTMEETINLPRGYEIEAPDNTDLEEAPATARMTWEVDGRKLKLTGSMKLEQRLIPAADFPSLRQVVDTITEQADQPIYAVK
jgi:hypothetical protein